MPGEPLSTSPLAHYMVVLARTTQPSEALAEYARRTATLVARHGGEYLVRGLPAGMLEGRWPVDTRLVISRWPSREAIESFWTSQEYQDAVRPLRAGTGIYDVAVFPEVA